MTQYIQKDTLVAEIERRMDFHHKRGNQNDSCVEDVLYGILSYINSLEVREVGISIPNIDDTLKEEGLDPDSKEAKVFKESYYLALEKLKEKKGEEV